MPQQNVESTRDFFQNVWNLYWRLVDENYLAHREVYARLNRLLKERGPAPFTVLDLGCGDASYMVKGLAGTHVARYTGVDVTPGALQLARANLDGLGFETRFVLDEYARYVQTSAETADIIWIGLSLHHLTLEQKQGFLADCRARLSPGGCMLVFEPLLRDGEARPAYLERWWATIQRAWSRVAPAEMGTIRRHVNEADFPESVATLDDLARAAGWAGARLVLADPTELYGLIAFDPPLPSGL